MRLLLGLVGFFLTQTACTVRKSQSSLESSTSALGASVFISACESQGKSDDVLLAKSLKEFALAGDCTAAWDKLQRTKKITLVGYGLRDVKLLAVLPHLEEIYLNNNSIEDMKPFASLKSLKKLNLSFNEVSDLKGLGGLSDLTELVLLGNRIVSLAPLSSLAQLKVLDVSENSLQDLAPISTLKNLIILQANDNAVKDLSPLETLKNLEQLQVERNQVKSLKPISHLTNLAPKRLKLEGNPVTKDGCPTSVASAAVTSYCLALRGMTP